MPGRLEGPTLANWHNVLAGAALMLVPSLPSMALAGDWGCTPGWWHEVAGQAPDGSAFALRQIAYFESDRPGGAPDPCGYPLGDLSTGAGGGVRPIPRGVSLTLCRPGKACKGEWKIYQPAEKKPSCTSESSARKALAEAKKALAAAGVDLSRKPTRVVLERATVPPEAKRILTWWAEKYAESKTPKERPVIPVATMKSFGIDQPLVLIQGIADNPTGRGPECNVVASAPGYGATKVLVVRNVGSCGGFFLGDAMVDTQTGLLFVNASHYCSEVTEAVRLSSVAARLLNSRGFEFHKAKDYAASASDFARSFELDPTYAQAAFNLACAQSLLGSSDDALASLKKAIALDQKKFKRKAQRDSDLSALRSDPRFKALLKQ